MKRLLVLFVLSITTINCDDDKKINLPNSIVNNSYHKYFDSKESKLASGGIAGDRIKSMDMTYYFINPQKFRVEGYVETFSDSNNIEIYGIYEYNPKTGKITLKYNQSYMGINTDIGYITEYELVINPIIEYRFKKVNK